jgi:hypothetical protein
MTKLTHEEALARIDVLEKAITEVYSRTGMLMHQNTGRWSNAVEHDRRTIGVLTTNQRICLEALHPGVNDDVTTTERDVGEGSPEGNETSP